MKRKAKRLGKLALGAVLAAGTALYVVPLFFPLPEGIATDPPQGLLFVDRHGEPVRRLLDGDLRAADPANFDEFPQVLIDATLAAEDSRFFSHNGIDFLGMGRAVRDAITEREFVSGASTVTQQTIKLYSPPRDRNFRTKFLEIFSARKLEMFADKETILTAYLNRLPYGNQFTGARAAAQGYFGKPIGDLSAAEAALLAGLPNRPTALNPWKNLDGARKRQMWILERMREEGYLDQARFAAAIVEPLRLLPGRTSPFHAPHVVDMLVAEETEALAAAEAAGRPVQTSIDLGMQKFAESVAASELARLAFQSGEDNDLQAAIVVIENATGEIVALVGSRAFHGSASGQVNGAVSFRSAGSTLKPFTYALAFERGRTAATVLADTPIEYVTATGTYQPVNFDRQFHGPVAARRALANSLNVPAVKLLDEIGGPPLLHSTMRDGLGFRGLADDSVEYGLGLTLGNAEVRLLDLTNAYACLARLGEWKPATLLAEGSIVEQGARPVSEGSSDDREQGGRPVLHRRDAIRQSATQQGLVNESTGLNRRVFDAGAAWLVADILSDDRARAEAFGLNSPLQLPFRAAAKTGTSTDFRDNWTVGFTPRYTVGVWVGRFDNRPLDEISGAMGAAPIFKRVMVELHRDREPEWYSEPEGAKRFVVDRLNGKRPPAGSKLGSDRVRREWFVAGAFPADATAVDYDDEGRTRLPSGYLSWWRSEANDLKSVAAVAEPTEESGGVPFRIVSPLEGTVAFLDPDLPASGSRFPLEVAGSGAEEIEWSSPSLEIESDGASRWLVLQPGEHEVVAVDTRTGRSARTRLKVEAL